MSYSPLMNESPAIPSLDQLRSNEVSNSPSVMEMQEKKNVEQQQGSAVMVESYVVQAAPAAATSRSQGRDKFIVSNCCCGCSLATGVYWIALLETISYVFSLFFAAMAIYLKTQENKIDHAIMKGNEEEDTEGTESPDAVTTEESADQEEEMTPEEQVDTVNRFIDMAAYTSPILILLSLVGLFMCYQGFKAAKGDVLAAHRYYRWKKFVIFWAFFQMIFGGGFGGFIGFLVAIYYCVVVRSHWLALSSEVAEPADSVVVTTVTEVRPNLV